MDTSQSDKSPGLCSNLHDIETTSENTEPLKEAVKTVYEESNSLQGNGDNGGTSTVQNNMETLNKSAQREENDENCYDNVSIQQDCKDTRQQSNHGMLKTMQKETIEILNVELVAPSSHDYPEAYSCVKETTGKDNSACNMENQKQIVQTEKDTNEVQNGSTKGNDLIDESHTPLSNSACGSSESNAMKHDHEIEILNVQLVAPSTYDLLEAKRCIEEKTIEDNDVINKSHSLSLQTVYDIMGNAVQEQIHDKINMDQNIIDMNDEIEESNCSSSSNSVCETMKNEEQKQADDNINLDDAQMDTNEEEASSDKSFNNTKTENTSIEAPKTSGLSLLAQYESDDDDTESVVEVPLTTGQEYRNQVVEIDSDSDTDDSSDSSDVEYLNELRKTIEKRIEIADEDEGDDEDQEEKSGKRRPQQKLRVKGELLLEDLPPIQDLQITVPENDCIEFGKIHSIVDQLVLVSALPNSILLDLETVIFLEKGQKVLGEVFDVLGQVADPWYCVRFNSNDQIKEREIKIGDVVYVAPKTQYTQYVILSNLMKTKGSDASWENDMEPPPKFLDYSDDEQEQLAKRQQRNKDRPNDNDDPSKRPRTESDDDAMSTSSTYQPRSQQRNRYEQRNNRGGPAGHSYVNHRPRFSGPPQNQQRNPNHHRSSWHSNYYPQQFPPQPTNNYRMHSPQNQLQSPQTYRPNMPVHAMPPVRNMSYPPPQPTQYVAPPMFQHNPPQLMPNTFSIRPPTLHGLPPNSTYDHQYTSAPPPHPGSQ